MKKLALVILSVLLCSFLVMFLQVRIAKAWSGTVHIRASGSVDPLDAPIQKSGDTFTLTGSIIGDTDGIVVERNGITLDGMGYSVQSKMSLSDDYSAIILNGRSEVTIRNFAINTSMYGIFLNESLNINIAGNEITNCFVNGIRIQGSYGTLYTPANNSITGNEVTKSGAGIQLELTLNNSISGNRIIDCYGEGITLDRANRNNIMENNITNNDRGIWLQESSNNLIVNNNIQKNGIGIHYHSSSSNVIYHNNLENNATQVDYNKPFNAGEDTDSINSWDNGYPSGGNYWGSYYSGTDSNGDGIGDTPYVINVNNRDNNPFMSTYAIPEFSLLLILPLFMILTLLTIAVSAKKARRQLWNSQLS